MNKQKTVFLFTLLFMFMLIGCSIEGWDYTWQYHGIGVDYDGALEFTLLQPDVHIEPRSGHASVVFNDAIWVFGGYNPNARGDRSAYLADVWYTEDGSTWIKVTDSAPWKGRRGHQVVVCNDVLYLLGGYRVYRENGVTYGGAANDVWRSVDGISWEEIKPNSYKTRVTHPAILMNEDVRGTDLYNPADDIDWYPRLDHTVAVYDIDGAGPGLEVMALFGGYAKEWMPYLNDGNNDETRKYFADFWVSEDGESWVQQEPMTLGGANVEIFGKYTAGRASAAHFIHDSELYVIGGTSWFNFQDTSAGFVVPGWDRVWRRSTAAAWNVLGPNDSAYIERKDHEIVAYDNAYWILPGCKPAAVQWYGGADTIWKISVGVGPSLSITRDGSPGTGSPMYGIADYSVEVFTPQTGAYVGQSAIFVLFGDGDGGVRNTTWRITKQGEGN